MADQKQLVDVSQTPTPMIDRSAPQEDKIPMNLLPVEQVPIEQTPEQEVSVEGTVEQLPTETPIIAPPPIQSDIDPYTGKPWREIALEEKRKREELADRLPQMIDEKLSKVGQPQQPAYTKQQLDMFLMQQQAVLMSNPTDDNALRAVGWAKDELDKIQDIKYQKMVSDTLGEQNKQREFDTIRQRTYESLIIKHPELLDQNSQMFNRVKQYMQLPEIGNRADGLAWATKLARADMLETQTPILQQKVQQAKADVKQAQKATLTEGAGRRVQPAAPPHQTAVDTLRKTGNIKDAESAMGAVLRARGIIVD